MHQNTYIICRPWSKEILKYSVAPSKSESHPKHTCKESKSSQNWSFCSVSWLWGVAISQIISPKSPRRRAGQPVRSRVNNSIIKYLKLSNLSCRRLYWLKCHLNILIFDPNLEEQWKRQWRQRRKTKSLWDRVRTMMDARGSPSTITTQVKLSLAQEIEKMNQNDRCLKNISICGISRNDFFVIPLKHTHTNVHRERGARTEWLCTPQNSLFKSQSPM